MSLAFSGALTSRAMLSRLAPQLLPRVQPLSLAVPAPRAVMQRTLQRRPIAMATAVGAAYTAGRAPVVRAPHLATAMHNRNGCSCCQSRRLLMMDRVAVLLRCLSKSAPMPAGAGRGLSHGRWPAWHGLECLRFHCRDGPIRSQRPGMWCTGGEAFRDRLQ